MLRPFRHLLSSVCPSSDQKAAFIGFDIWPIKAAAQIGRRVKGITKNFSAHPGAGVKRGGIESARSRKKYPLTISGERVSLSHLNLMTLGSCRGFVLHSISGIQVITNQVYNINVYIHSARSRKRGRKQKGKQEIKNGIQWICDR